MFYEAIYEPSKTEHLQGEAKKFIGSKLALQDGGQLMSGPYKGHDCFIPSHHFGLVPACDLKGLRNISYGRWKEIHEESKLQRKNP